MGVSCMRGNRLKLTTILVAVSFLYSCATTSVATDKGPNVIITETGIEAIGIGVSQNEKLSKSIAVRLARMNLAEYLNTALANTYKELEIQDIVELKENILQNSKVIENNSFVQRKNITTKARVGITLEDISKWEDSYYDYLQANVILESQITKGQFMEILSKHLHINF